MLLSLIRYIKGYIRIRVIGYSAERFLNACSNKGIYLWGLVPSNGSYEMYISVREFRQLKPIIRKTGTKIVIVEKSGLPFFFHRYRHRKMFFAGAFICVCVIYALSLFIWDIQIEGNMTRTDEILLDYLKTKNVECGMKKSKTDCARIVKDIRKEYDDIIWVSASVKGTQLLIQIKENEDSLPKLEHADKDQEEALDIVSDQDCTIVKMITRRGVPMIQEGAGVKKGDLLVSGRVEVKDDAGGVIGYQYQASDADIYGKTVITYESDQELNYVTKTDTGVEKKEYYLKIGGRRFGFGSLHHNYKNFDLASKETRWKIGPSFYLPISSGIRTIKPYVPKTQTYTKEELQRILSKDFQRYCDDLEKKGVEIIQNDVKIYTGPKKATARGTLTVIVPVGEKTPTEVLQVPDETHPEEESED